MGIRDAHPVSEAHNIMGSEHGHSPEPTARGFEPLRAEPNGFLVHLLNHSDTLSLEAHNQQTWPQCSCWGTTSPHRWHARECWPMLPAWPPSLFSIGLYSSVAERQSCKLKVLGSIPSGGSFSWHTSTPSCQRYQCQPKSLQRLLQEPRSKAKHK